MNPDNLEPAVDMVGDNILRVPMEPGGLNVNVLRHAQEMMREQALRNGEMAFRAYGMAGQPIMHDPFDVAEFDGEEQDFNLISPDELKETLKKKHLNRIERDAFHRPKSDWSESPSGEVCKNAETLVVSDIIKKYSKK